MGLRLLPSFTLDLEAPSQEVLARLPDRLAAGPQELRSTRTPGGGESRPRDEDHFILTVAESERHLWSPWLTVEVTPRDGGTHLYALFSPNPSLWTGFAFGYLTLGVLSFFALIFGGAMMLNRQPPWPLALTGACWLGMLGLWWASQIGERLARSQMEALQGVLMSGVEACGFPTRRSP